MSTNVDMSQKSTIYAPIGYRMNLKRAIVNSLRVTFNKDYPDETMRNMFISLDWPDRPQQYPMMLLDYQETSLHRAGVGHFGIYNGRHLFKRWLYEGTVQLVIVAHTSLQREFIADQFVNMFAFGSLGKYTKAFIPYFNENRGLDVQILTDTLTPAASTVEKGSNFGWEDMTFYVAGYSFGVFGSFTSAINSYGYVRGVNASFTVR